MKLSRYQRDRFNRFVAGFNDAARESFYKELEETCALEVRGCEEAIRQAGEMIIELRAEIEDLKRRLRPYDQDFDVNKSYVAEVIK